MGQVGGVRAQLKEGEEDKRLIYRFFLTVVAFHSRIADTAHQEYNYFEDGCLYPLLVRQAKLFLAVIVCNDRFFHLLLQEVTENTQVVGISQNVVE